VSEYLFHDDTSGCDIFLKLHRVVQQRKKRIKVHQMFDHASGLTVQGAIMQVQMTDIQSVTLSIAAEDARGNPAVLGDVPVWAVSDATLATVTPAADGMSCVVAAVGPLGTPQVTVTAHGALADGTPDLADTITGSVDFTIVSSEATQFVVTASAPV